MKDKREGTRRIGTDRHSEGRETGKVQKKMGMREREGVCVCVREIEIEIES